ncbi:MAG TPA: hypothetical protein VMW01_04915, partial [Williamwhitmania sp.]|nr:hypothetical protein [Williamwhitmania sp.]
MKDNGSFKGFDEDILALPDLSERKRSTYSGSHPKLSIQKLNQPKAKQLAEILFVTSYPPRECGIATYSQDLIAALNNKFSSSLSIRICALESGNASYRYPSEVKLTLDTSNAEAFGQTAKVINKDRHIKIVLVQHEFGFFSKQEIPFLHFLKEVSKPVVIVFHTVLPHPDEVLQRKVVRIAAACTSIVV